MNEFQEHLYAIGEVAKLTGVPIKTIRYYTDIGLLTPTRVTEARFRLYSTEAIWQLQLIRALRQLEFSLEEIRALLGGKLAAGTAIDWQLEAVTQHIHRLQRVQEVLQQAREVQQQPEQSLQRLYQLSIALGENAAERSRFVTEKLHELVARAKLPEPWRQQLLQHFTWQSPTTLTAQQLTAWAEIVSILNDPAFAIEALRFNTHSNQEASNNTHTAKYDQQQPLAIIQAAQEAALRGDSSEGETVQTLVKAWISFAVTTSQQTLTPELLQCLSTEAETYHSELFPELYSGNTLNSCGKGFTG